MPKNILIFSDGTGQIGGLRPDQRLSNIYKMFRATRSGPDSHISPDRQVAFYDAGLGAGETGGLTFRRIRNTLASAVGTGISENMIDCYEAIIANYEPGDKVFLFGFSRGAYTARCVANVMNLCGVPTKTPDGGRVPRYGPELRKIASDAVLYVYEHGSGKSRGEYEDEREEKAKRFRNKYHSQGTGAEGEPQGNVQPSFIGAFDTVAALGSGFVRSIALVFLALLLVLSTVAFLQPWTFWLAIPIWIVTATVLCWLAGMIWRQLKFFTEEPSGRIKSWHFATWKLQHYDMFLDNKVRFARHALAIDEARKNFPHVGWGSSADVVRNAHLQPAWLKQVWFSGNHSDIGGSYPESESRLSDIALRWMVDELVEAEPTVLIDWGKLNTYPSPTGMQHDEITSVKNSWPWWVPNSLRERLTWPRKIRHIHSQANLHDTVSDRFEAVEVSQMGAMKPYRPENLKDHLKTHQHF